MSRQSPTHLAAELARRSPLARIAARTLPAIALLALLLCVPVARGENPATKAAWRDLFTDPTTVPSKSQQQALLQAIGNDPAAEPTPRATANAPTRPTYRE